MCIAGAIFSCLSIVLSIFSPNVGVLMLTYGIMGGFGVGCIYLPAVVACGYYFEKRRALATGLFSVFSLQNRFFVVIWPKKPLRNIKYRPRNDPFFSKNQNFDPKHKIPKNQWEKLKRFHYCQISKF